MSLIEGAASEDAGAANEPLAARMRPRDLTEFFGQEHLVGEGKILRQMIERDQIPSMILWGPPGVGKTTLANVVANLTKAEFVNYSAVTSGIKEIKEVMHQADEDRAFGRKTIVFVDEIHRFNKAQQDVLLPYVEDGTVILIGATTHNPNMFVNTPLTSRSLVFELKPLSKEAVAVLVDRAVKDVKRGFGTLPVELAPEARDFLAEICDGDARHALTALEVAVLSTNPGPDGKIKISLGTMQECVQRRRVQYDKNEDGHYDTISAFIKSIRGSDPDAAMYWLAKMVSAGEDPRFIARRLVISASEDIGNADPRGLTVAVAAMHAVEFVGMPEARISLAQATAYLATAPKSNAAYMALEKASADIRSGRVQPVPEHLKNVHVKAIGAEEHDGYKYPHDYPATVVDQAYLRIPAEYYKPKDSGYEATIAKRMAWLRAAKRDPAAAKPPAQ